MLDDVGFAGENILRKSVIDPACGDGQFLTAVVRRILRHAPADAAAECLKCVHGWDIDADAVAACKAQLDAAAAEYGVAGVEWNIRVCDALRQPKGEGFDFVIGNPPYIRIQHLPEDTRNYLRTQFRFCGSGSTDIYIAFYELAYTLLTDSGKCAFITPNTFFYTATARQLRDFLAEESIVERVVNYADVQLFEAATTYSAILTFGKETRTQFTYEQATDKNAFAAQVLSAEVLRNRPFWQLALGEQPSDAGVRLGDICRIHVGITTLCDKAYIFPIREASETTAIACSRLTGEVEIERALLRPIVKGSLLKSSDDAVSEWLLFPYEQRDGKTSLIPEARLQREFPKAYAYLCAVKPQLDKRDNGKPNRVAWYAFGRSQGLETTFGKKIIFSPMNNRPNFVLHTREDCTLYSGYCIKFDGDYEWLLAQLNSERMAQFIAVSGRDFRGGWKAYNKQTLSEFRLE